MMTTTRFRNVPRPCLRVVACALALFAMGGALAEDKLQLTGASFLEIDELVIAAKGRPNEEHRLRGLKSYKTGHYRDALKSFEVAAYNADKYSQHYLSLMCWHGVGTERDPVQAYIWSDLAAERGSKPLLVVREKIWSQLTPGQQAQVQARGEDSYARYGDAVAKPRAESVMRHFARDMTGSRVGFRNQRLEVVDGPSNGAFGKPGSSNQLDVPPTADALYGEEGGLRRLGAYWQQQDRLLEGNVEVGPLQSVPTPKGASGMNG
jgi:hypothetical protein